MIKGLLKLLDTVLSLLPLNGWKTLLGLLLKLFADRYHIPVEFLNPLLDWLGIGLMGVGSTHIAVKNLLNTMGEKTVSQKNMIATAAPM